MTKPFEALHRQRGSLLWAVGFLLLFMCGTLVLITGVEERGHLDLAKRWPTLSSLFGLVLLFVLYVQHKHQQLAVLEKKFRDMAVREATAQARFAELSFLFDISTQLQLRLDLGSMLDLAVQRLLPCLDGHQASIMLHNPETGRLEVKATAGGDSALVSGASVPAGEGIAGHVFLTGETLMLTPEVIARHFPGGVKPERTITSALCAPLRFRGSSIGVIAVTRSEGDPFGAMHAQMLTAFAEHCAATIVKTHHHHEMLQQMHKVA